MITVLVAAAMVVVEDERADRWITMEADPHKGVVAGSLTVEVLMSRRCVVDHIFELLALLVRHVAADIERYR